MIRTLLILCAFPTFAMSMALEEFAQRCVAPMENVGTPRFDDLTRDEGVKGLDTGVKAYVLTEIGAHLLVGHDPTSCMVRGVDLGNGLARWVDQIVADGRYEENPDGLSHGPLVLRSTQWREPKMEIVIHWTSEGQSQAIIAIETNLES